MSADLTKRERQVLGFIAAGLPDKLIAVELGISEPGVKSHANNIRRKLGLYSRAQMMLYAHGIDAVAALEAARNFEAGEP